MLEEDASDLFVFDTVAYTIKHQKHGNNLFEIFQSQRIILFSKWSFSSLEEDFLIVGDFNAP